jgi:zinc protease
MKKIYIAFLVATTFIGCKNSSEEKTPELSINYTKIELENGLDVVFHVDKSDPVVAV